MKLARIFQSGAVLQRQKNVTIFGTREDTERICVRLYQGERCLSEVEASVADGRFEAILPPQKAGTGFCVEVISDGGEKVVLEDILFGDVWLLGGQSNMEFLMKYDAQREAVKESLPEPMIRFYEVPKVSYEGQLEDEDHSDEGIWRRGETYEDVRLFSAVGFYFARKVREALEEDVPFGLIGCNWGGASASCFLNEKYLVGELQGYLDLKHNFDGVDYNEAFEGFKKSRAMQRTPEAMARLDHMMENAITAPMHFEMPKEMIEQFRKTKYAPFSQFRPCGLYDTMIRTIVPYGIKGFLWYQGEEDCANYPLNYARLMDALIACWREEWSEEDLPFIFAQLPIFKNQGGFNGLDYVPVRAWQEENSKTSKNTYMVVTLDAGMPYEIHPKEKRPVGERMAFQALKNVYGIPTHAESASPMACSVADGKVLITFKLDSEDAALCMATCPKDATEVTVNGLNAEYGEVSVSGNTLCIEVPNLKVGDRVVVRYGIKDTFEVALFDTKGLPVRPFTVMI